MAHQFSEDWLPFEGFCSPHAVLFLSTKTNSLRAKDSVMSISNACTFAERRFHILNERLIESVVFKMDMPPSFLLWRL